MKKDPENRVAPPRSLSDVPRYIKELVGGFFSRLAYIFTMVWKTGKWILISLVLISLLEGVYLWAFNEEIVVAAVHDCTLPVISAVGHEIDFSLTDFAADLRAPTPSAAAELAVPELGSLLDRLTQSRDRLRSALLHGVERKQDRLELLIRRRGALLTEQRLLQEQQRLDQCRDTLEEGIERQLQRRQDALAAIGTRLRAADPLGALDRGFALVYDEQGAMLRRAEDIAVGQGIVLRFRDGDVDANVTGKDMYEKE